MSFIVYRAAAGSGKTYSLVREYLNLCLKTRNFLYFKRILALTFTNKAAAEMRDRILLALEQIDHDAEKVHGLMDDLKGELDISKAELQLRARSTRVHILHHYSDFAIMTIDKFVNKLVRAFALDLNLEKDYTIELNDGNIIAEAVDRLIKKVGEDKEISEILKAFVLERVEGESDWQIRSQLESFGQIVFKEKLADYLVKLNGLSAGDILKAKKTLKKENDDIKSWPKSKAAGLLKMLESNGISHSSFPTGSLPKLLKRIAINGEEKNAHITEDQGKPAFNKKTLLAIESGEFLNKGAPENDKAAFESLASDFQKEMQELLEFFRGPLYAKYRLNKLVLRKVHQLAVLGEIQKEAAIFQEEEQTFTFSDLNKKISQIVRDNPAPFIYERLSERYSHFLIDEFQDTSVIQWQNLLPLVEDSLAKDQFNLVVGDSKQAIYRWRNGDVMQFHKLPYSLQEPENPVERQRENTLKRQYKEVLLQKNYRSDRKVVEFNNQLFSSLKEKLNEEKRPVFSNVVQEPNEEEAGFVRAEVSLYKDAEQRKDNRIEKILQYIEEWKNLGYQLGDMAILCRTNSISAEIAEGLFREGIKLETADSLKLKANPAVKALVAFIEAISMEKNQKAKLLFVQFIHKVNPSIFDFTDVFETFTKFREQGSSTFDFEGFLKEYFPKIRLKEIKNMNLYQAAETIIDGLGLGKAYPMYCVEILQVILEYQMKESASFVRFIDWWDQNASSLSLNTGSNDDSVKITTIHKSKGLEYPCVIVLIEYKEKERSYDLSVHLDEHKYHLPMAMVSTGLDIHGTDVEDSHIEEINNIELEELNTAYVACTRAVNSLKLVLELKEVRDKASWSKRMSGKMLEVLHHDFNWNFEEGPLELGEDGKKSESASSEVNKGVTEIESLDRLILGDRTRLSIDSEGRDLNDSLTEIAKGELFHQLMARIYSAADFERIKKKEFPWQQMTKEEWNQLLKSMEQLVYGDATSAWFADGLRVLNESSLINQSDATKRPDRVIFTEDQTVIVDYKTGQPSKSHIKQVKEYLEAVNNIDGKPAKGFVYYTENSEVVEVGM